MVGLTGNGRLCLKGSGPAHDRVEKLTAIEEVRSLTKVHSKCNFVEGVSTTTFSHLTPVQAVLHRFNALVTLRLLFEFCETFEELSSLAPRQP